MRMAVGKPGKLIVALMAVLGIYTVFNSNISNIGIEARPADFFLPIFDYNLTQLYRQITAV